MNARRITRAIVAAAAAACAIPAPAQECCLSGLFAGCGACFRKPPAYAVAPVAAPIVAPPPPVMVPVQQTSYVPETTYRTQYQCVPVTTYKPACEIDPCTGCATECMQPVTQYVQQAVNVPVTQYRAVTTTKYVQMQPGYGAPAGMAAPMPYPAAPAPTGVVAPAASPFAAPALQQQPPPAVPQGWGAAGTDVPQQLLPGQPSINPPALPATGYPTQQVVPQAGTYAPQPLQPMQPQAVPAPALAPTPSLRPIPELPRSAAPAAAAPPAAAGSPAGTPAIGTPAIGSPSAVQQPRGIAPGAGSGTAAPALQPGSSGAPPQVPGTGPTGSTRAFPRLLEPTGHTTSWQPAAGDRMAARGSYPTAALPARLAQ